MSDTVRIEAPLRGLTRDQIDRLADDLMDALVAHPTIADPAVSVRHAEPAVLTIEWETST